MNGIAFICLNLMFYMWLYIYIYTYIFIYMHYLSSVMATTVASSLQESRSYMISMSNITLSLSLLKRKPLNVLTNKCMSLNRNNATKRESDQQIKVSVENIFILSLSLSLSLALSLSRSLALSLSYSFYNIVHN